MTLDRQKGNDCRRFIDVVTRNGKLPQLRTADGKTIRLHELRCEDVIRTREGSEVVMLILSKQNVQQPKNALQTILDFFKRGWPIASAGRSRVEVVTMRAGRVEGTVDMVTRDRNRLVKDVQVLSDRNPNPFRHNKNFQDKIAKGTSDEKEQDNEKIQSTNLYARGRFMLRKAGLLDWQKSQ